MEMVLCSPPELRGMISEEMQRVLRDSLADAVRRATAKPYLSKKELMELTGWSSRQVEYRKANRSIPFVKRGRTILFPTEEIYEFLDKGKVEVER